ncbi:hypothetical protein [Streptomyces sp. NPDC001604]|uniref:hypothetical protein n=1 Tax=Streptomyces sp. NPDC001604 TaxID=3364593 RepID=UPI0036CDEADD
MSAPAAVQAFLSGVQLYDQTNDIATLDHAITAGRMVVSTEQDIETWRVMITVLGQALLRRYEATRDRDALAESVQALRTVSHNLPVGHKTRPKALLTLGQALREAANNEGRMDIADEAIHWFEQCATIPSGVRSDAYFGLSTCLKFKADRTGDPVLLQHAAGAARYAVGFAPDSMLRGRNLLYLATLLALLHRKTGQPDAIREAVEACKEAVRLSPEGPERRNREKTAAVLQIQADSGWWLE